MARVYEDPQALAQAVRRARKFADLTVEELGDELGVSDGTVKRWERAELPSLGKTPQARRAVAAQVAEVTGVPRDWLGLDPSTTELVEETRRAVGALATLATVPDLGPAARRLLEAELAFARQWSTSSRPTGEPGTGEASG